MRKWNCYKNDNNNTKMLLCLLHYNHCLRFSLEIVLLFLPIYCLFSLMIFIHIYNTCGTFLVINYYVFHRFPSFSFFSTLHIKILYCIYSVWTSNFVLYEFVLRHKIVHLGSAINCFCSRISPHLQPFKKVNNV